MHFGDLFGDRHEVGHRRERPAQVVLIEPCGDDAKASCRESITNFDDAYVEELRFVDRDDLGVVMHALFDARARGYGDGFDADRFVADDSLGVITIIDPRFEGLDALTRKNRAFDASNELFCFSAEHRSGDYFDRTNRTGR